jgi:hypothetical protein
MSLQYISDNNGQTTGVFIPIQEWNDLKNKFKGLDEAHNVPEWQITESQRRLDLVDKGQMKTRSWDDAKKDIFKRK